MFCFFVNEEHCQVATGIRSTVSGVQFLFDLVALFNEAKVWTIRDNFAYLIRQNSVLPGEFVNNVLKPDIFTVSSCHR